MGGGIPVILVGTSHGGYVAHLMAKISPWDIAAVIDNSSYAKVFLPSVGFAKELDYIKYCETSHINQSYPNLKLNAFTKTHFTSNCKSDYYFSKAHYRIRNILDEEHLKIQANFPKPIYISYHSAKDFKIAPLSDKIELYNMLKMLNFDATLNIIDSEEQIDHKFIKTLDHGMGMSMKMLINKELPIVLEKIKNSTKHNLITKAISYPSEHLMYNFKCNDNNFLDFVLLKNSN